MCIAQQNPAVTQQPWEWHSLEAGIVATSEPHHYGDVLLDGFMTVHRVKRASSTKKHTLIYGSLRNCVNTAFTWTTYKWKTDPGKLIILSEELA